MSDKEMNEILKSKISKDLMFIRLNGAFVGGIIGTILFFEIIFIQKFDSAM